MMITITVVIAATLLFVVVVQASVDLGRRD